MANHLMCPECGWTGTKDDGTGSHVCPVCGADIEG